MCEMCRVYYMTKGSIRGSCRHEHLTIYGEYSCLSQDSLLAQKEGIGSDRRVLAVEDGRERELCEQEVNQLDQWIRFASWEIISD